MEANRRDMYGSRKPRFSGDTIVGDPFALATCSIAVVRAQADSEQVNLTNGFQIAWLIAFISSIISKINGGLPNFLWWTLVYMFFCIAGVLVTVASDSVYTYHVAVSTFRTLKTEQF